MGLPKFVNIKEVGPREGMQFEKGPISTADKIRLVDMLSDCNFKQIEVTSFVSPKWVPQMADADEVTRAYKRRPGTEYNCIFLNAKGLERAVAHGKFDMRGTLWATASDTFSKKNTNRSIEETYVDLAERIGLFKSFNIPVERIGVMAAFGCNFEGDIDQQHVVEMVARLIDIAQRQDVNITSIALADTMGWATPLTMRRMLGSLRDRWPEKRINLHLHDTRGLGLSNAFAAMEMGVDDFDAAVGGLGGCPYGGFKGAAGNISSEDLVHMCHELGIETGVDLDRLIETAREAETIVGHPLPGKLIQGTPLKAYRRTLAA
ncbi:hydroxymethylglutaryl-CoA lyase [Bradyrhizobium sp. LHD-71]|uniref:hydroxymethylglutaryl-CoA lyase n=1 Tax=Bradyrhizobium sp. LHD-71 TaxID=3072141 RepID=UPI00280F2873|nr:hydroxymethylglutaryl-CoA lyase [Bradyrhizobium sp. LHD-71]MDQ8729193.1 hydroxymethylglutaryl-CoA lyase [Bradyrhizobium sp. LHD-71]